MVTAPRRSHPSGRRIFGTTQSLPAGFLMLTSVKDAYEAVWMPTLEALARQKALQADPAVARLFIFGALNWAVQWFAAPKKKNNNKQGKSLDELTDEALALFICGEG